MKVASEAPEMVMTPEDRLSMSPKMSVTPKEEAMLPLLVRPALKRSVASRAKMRPVELELETAAVEFARSLQ